MDSIGLSSIKVNLAECRMCQSEHHNARHSEGLKEPTVNIVNLSPSEFLWEWGGESGSTAQFNRHGECRERREHSCHHWLMYAGWRDVQLEHNPVSCRISRSWPAMYRFLTKMTR